MKFLSNLYTVSTICRDVDVPYAIIRFNPDHELYKSHFPDNPVTPGVVLLQIVTVVLEDMVGKSLRLEEAGDVKFYKSVGPSATATITYNKLTEQNNQMKTAVRIEIEDVVYAKMSLTYKVVAHS